MVSQEKLSELNKKYGKEKVEEGLKFLSYHKADPLPKQEENNKLTLYVFRHGQSVDNAAFVFSGWRHAPITEEGMKQALVLAPKLRDKKIDMLISSPQERAYETMKIAICLNDNARRLKIETDERIKERSYGDWQGESKLEAHLRDPEGLMKVRRDFYSPPPNGESIGDVAKRVGEFCDEIVPLMKKNNISVAVSCHGNSIRGFRYYFEDMSPEEAAEVETPLGQDYAAYKIE